MSGTGINHLEFETSPVRYHQIFSRLPKDVIRTKCQNFKNDNVELDKDWDAYNLLLDLAVIALVSGYADKKVILHPKVLEIWKEHVAVKPQLGFCETTWPNKISQAEVQTAYNSLLNDDHYNNVLECTLPNEVMISHHNPFRYKGKDKAPLEKTTLWGYINNYMKGEYKND